MNRRYPFYHFIRKAKYRTMFNIIQFFKKHTCNVHIYFMCFIYNLKKENITNTDTLKINSIVG